MDDKINKNSAKIKKIRGSVKLPKNFQYKIALSEAIAKKHNDRLKNQDTNL